MVGTRADRGVPADGDPRLRSSRTAEGEGCSVREAQQQRWPSVDYGDLTIGVLALQGAFAEHVAALRRLGAEAREVRLSADLEGLDGLVLPGGESTTIGKLLEEFGLLEPLRTWAREGRPLYGTCAGAILLARDIGGLDQPLVGVMDLQVERNAFGRQLQSFETELEVPRFGPEPFPAVFIRAPAILGVGPGVEVLASLPDGPIVAAEQGPILVTCFHPELSGDLRFHHYFLEMVLEQKRRVAASPATSGTPALRTSGSVTS